MGASVYRPGPIERFGEFVARQHLSERLSKVDREIRDPSVLPLAWVLRRNVIPGIYKLWVGFEYDAAGLSGSAMAFRLELLYRPFFQDTTPKDAGPWSPRKPTGWGQGLELQRMEVCPYHAMQHHVQQAWCFADRDLSFPMLWQSAMAPQIGKPELRGEVVVERGVHPSYRRILVRDRSDLPEADRTRILPFETVREYKDAWREGKRLCRRSTR